MERSEGQCWSLMNRFPLSKDTVGKSVSSKKSTGEDLENLQPCLCITENSHSPLFLISNSDLFYLSLS